MFYGKKTFKVPMAGVPMAGVSPCNLSTMVEHKQPGRRRVGSMCVCEGYGWGGGTLGRRGTGDKRATGGRQGVGRPHVKPSHLSKRPMEIPRGSPVWPFKYYYMRAASSIRTSVLVVY